MTHDNVLKQVDVSYFMCKDTLGLETRHFDFRNKTHILGKTWPLAANQQRVHAGKLWLCPAPPDYTYFYKGMDYWKFDNQKLTVEPGYPKSILRDWMSCDQSHMERPGVNGNHGDRQVPLDDVDIMVTINDVPTTVNAIAVVIPCVLSLCILVLVYTIFQFKNKGGQQDAITQHYYKYPVQEWVWPPLRICASADGGRTEDRDAGRWSSEGRRSRTGPTRAQEEVPPLLILPSNWPLLASFTPVQSSPPFSLTRLSRLVKVQPIHPSAGWCLTIPVDLAKLLAVTPPFIIGLVPVMEPEAALQMLSCGFDPPPTGFFWSCTAKSHFKSKYHF